MVPILNGLSHSKIQTQISVPYNNKPLFLTHGSQRGYSWMLGQGLIGLTLLPILGLKFREKLLAEHVVHTQGQKLKSICEAPVQR